jgi:GxxExxY protein
MDKIIECIKTVESLLGNYYKENIYQSALCVELNLNGFIIQSEVIVPIVYKGHHVGYERADIVVYSGDASGTIICILELKSQNTRLSSKEINQLKKYITNLHAEVGLLVNFYEKMEIIKVHQYSHTKIC